MSAHGFKKDSTLLKKELKAIKETLEAKGKKHKNRKTLSPCFKSFHFVEFQQTV